MSTAFDFLFDKLDHKQIVQFGVRIITDALRKVQSVCPAAVLDLCDKCINIFEGLKKETEEKFADQLKECEETGTCKSHQDSPSVVGSTVHRIIEDVMGIKLDDAGAVIRESLPDKMPEDVKDMLMSDVGKLKATVEQLRSAKTHEDRVALIEMFRDSIHESADTLAN